MVEIVELEFGTHGFFKNHVFLPTEQAGTNICWIIYKDANFKICLSLFGWKENILHKRWNASEKENEFSISNHISFEKPETKFPRRSWTILFLQNRGQTNSTFIWRVFSAWACVKLWLNFLKMFMGKFAFINPCWHSNNYILEWWTSSMSVLEERRCEKRIRLLTSGLKIFSNTTKWLRKLFYC